MIKIRTKEVELQLSDYREIIAARKDNEKLVSEVLGAIRRYEQSVKEQLEGGHEPLITEEEFLKQLARECWTSIPPNWLSKDASRRREVKQLTAPNLIIPSARSGGEGEENGENGRHHPKVDVNENYLVVLRERNPVRQTPFKINPNIPLPLSFETLRSRRILNGQPASMRENAPPSVFSPLFSHYKPNNASLEELSEQERDIFKQSVLPGKPQEEKEEPKKSNADTNTPVRSKEEIKEIVERVLNDRTAVQQQNQEVNVQRKEALLNHSKRHFRL